MPDEADETEYQQPEIQSVVEPEARLAEGAKVEEGTLQQYLLRLMLVLLPTQQSIKELGTNKAELKEPLLEEKDAIKGDGELCKEKTGSQ